MKTMQRIIAGFMALLLAMSLVACDRDSAFTQTQNPTTQPPRLEAVETEPAGTNSPETTVPSETEPPDQTPEQTPEETPEETPQEKPQEKPEETPEEPPAEPEEPPAAENHTHSWAAATCTKPATCRTCGATEGQALGHTWQTAPGKAPTKTQDGYLGGVSCSVCRAVSAKQVTVPSYAVLYSGDFYYTQLLNYAKGSAMQKLYRRLDEAAMRFHFDTSIQASNATAFLVSYADLGISEEEATIVLQFYQEDHPLYYWISSYKWNSKKEVGYGIDAAYASGAARKTQNEKITQAVFRYLAMVAGESSAYQIALRFHDEIILNTKYVYDPVTGKPEDDAWAHNIVGFLDGRGVVCEGYARMYQLLLNAAGIQNILVTGNAGSPGYMDAHAWNLLKLEDGGWYWCDLTWDDRAYQYLGVTYNHFCVNDTQDINWMHGGWAASEISFLDNHAPNVFSDGRQVGKINLPARSATVFSGNTPKIRDIFTVDGMHYSVNGANTVQLVKIEKSGAITIPETVTYQGRKFTVNAIGSADAKGLYDTSSVIPVESGVTTVYIPKTIRFIWDFAFHYGGTGFIVAEDNPNFRSLDGCLYTKSLYTLIKYPAGRPRADRFVIPEETHLIAYGALSSGSVRFYELVLGKNVEDIGIANWGSGYQDKPAVEGEEDQIIYGNRIVGTLGYIRDALETTACVTISVAEGNTRYSVVDGIVYQYGDVVVAAATSDLVHAVIREGTTRIEGWTFNACAKLESVTIPTSVTGFIGSPFVNCRSLREIRYLGTMAQWHEIYKDDAMNFFLNDVQVICTDGTIDYPSIYH